LLPWPSIQWNNFTWSKFNMLFRKVWISLVCVTLLLSTSSAFARDRDVDGRDLHGISPKHYKYVLTVVGGFAAGAGLGYILPGSKTPLKLGMIGSGAANAWYLHTHRRALGGFHDWAMIGGNTVLGGGIGWLGCNCNDGVLAGTLLGGGTTAAWEALKDDSALQTARRNVKQSPQP
jgi:hypothetical protein